MKGRYFSAALALAFLAPLVLLTSCNSGKTPFTYSIDKGIVKIPRELPGLSGGPPRLVGAMIAPDGKRDDFAAEEVTMAVSQPKELDAFLKRYNGHVLRSGMPQPIEGLTPPGYKAKSSGLYLIHIDLGRSSLGDLASNMEAANYRGHFTFSSEAAVRLVAILARERTLPIGPNILMRGADIPEHPTAGGGHLDAATWPWMTETGLSVGTVHAWDYLRYKAGIPPSFGPGGGSANWKRTYVAIIDSGFALDETTGIPLNNNKDYFYYGAKPLQADLVDQDGTAGGRNRMGCTGGTPCPWHGQENFGVFGAIPGNGFGSAGTGGPVVVPILVKVDWTWYGALEGMYTLADAIRASVLFGSGRNSADVISISITGKCVHICGLTEAGGLEDFPDYMQRTILTATSFGAVVVAAAGNDSENASGSVPCALQQVICVGAIGRNNTTGLVTAKSYSNFGRSVDIWAPTNILSTTDPDTVNADANDTCNNSNPNVPSCDELAVATGTSAATPFVAGIIALMVALDRNSGGREALPIAGTGRIERIQQILQETANSSSDPKVYRGYVDAFRAVSEVRPNEAPAVTFTFPNNGTMVPWTAASSYFSIAVSDPEQAARPWLGPSNDAKVILTSDTGVQICNQHATAPWQSTYECPRPEETLGQHRITATVTDPFGATATTSIAIDVVDRAPDANIELPADGRSYFSDQTIQFVGYGSDPDDETLPDSAFRWTSNIDGYLGSGRQITASLTRGVHTVTMAVTDAKGLVGQDSINLTIRAGTGQPSAIITEPAPFTFHGEGELISFKGIGVDPEDGTLPGAQLSWYSNWDGFLGHGNSLQKVLSGPPAQPCEASRRHVITLVVQDRDGNMARQSIWIDVGRVC